MDGGEKFLLVDVREDNEWEKGHIPGAVHMGKGVIERDIEGAVSRHRGENHSLLWWRIPICTGGRKFAKDGLYKRGVHGRRLEGLARSRIANGQGIGRLAELRGIPAFRFKGSEAHRHKTQFIESREGCRNSSQRNIWTLFCCRCGNRRSPKLAVDRRGCEFAE